MIASIAVAAEIVEYVPVQGMEVTLPTVSVAPAAIALEAKITRPSEKVIASVLGVADTFQFIDFSFSYDFVVSSALASQGSTPNNRN